MILQIKLVLFVQIFTSIVLNVQVLDISHNVSIVLMAPTFLIPIAMIALSTPSHALMP